MKICIFVPNLKTIMFMKKVYLLIDIENVSIKNKRDALSDLASRLAIDGYVAYKIGLASKTINQLNDWKEMCINIFQVNVDSIITIKVASGYDSADMALCFIAGYWCKENETKKYPFVILSNDKILKKVEIYIKLLDIDCLSYNLDFDSFKRIKCEKESIIFDKEFYPYGYNECQITIPHLDVVTHPIETDHPISYIPIPNIGEEITFGISRSDAYQHISLDYWDQQKKHTLYPIHSYIGYKNNSQLYVRSSKGFRRGPRSVEINGTIIDSSRGNVPLKDGDILKIGGFVFKVVIPLCYSNRELIKGDSVDSIVKNTEILLHQWIRKSLESSNENWWIEQVREDIRIGCEERKDSPYEHPYNYTFLRDLDKIVKDNWDLFCMSISPFYMSKGKFDRSLSQFITIRNKVMHPTRIDLAGDEVTFLNDFYYTINAIVNS